MSALLQALSGGRKGAAEPEVRVAPRIYAAFVVFSVGRGAPPPSCTRSPADQTVSMADAVLHHAVCVKTSATSRVPGRAAATRAHDDASAACDGTTGVAGFSAGGGVCEPSARTSVPPIKCEVASKGARPPTTRRPPRAAKRNRRSRLRSSSNFTQPVPSFAATAQGAPAEPPATGLAAVAPAPLPEDAPTPDAWVPRDARLLRLTGRHPFNCEPPPDALEACGGITTPGLHFVRNHGAVPRREWGEHTVTVAGVVDAPTELTMDQIVAMPARTLTVTMACAGNRRKEQNMHRKSQVS